MRSIKLILLAASATYAQSEAENAGEKFAVNLACKDKSGNRLSISAGKHIFAYLQIFDETSQLPAGSYGLDLGSRYGRQTHPGILRSFDINGTHTDRFPVAIKFSEKTPYGPQLPVGTVTLRTPEEEIEFSCVGHQ